jgi:excisionase family DNA binding protein
MSHSGTKRRPGRSRKATATPRPEATTASDTSEIMTVRDVAKYLKCHYITVYKLVRRGELTGVFRLGANWRFRRADLERWIERREARSSAAAASKPSRRRRRNK